MKINVKINKNQLVTQTKIVKYTRSNENTMLLQKTKNPEALPLSNLQVQIRGESIRYDSLRRKNERRAKVSNNSLTLPGFIGFWATWLR